MKSNGLESPLPQSRVQRRSRPCCAWALLCPSSVSSSVLSDLYPFH